MDTIVCDIDNTISDQYLRYFRYYDFDKDKLMDFAFSKEFISRDKPLSGARVSIALLQQKYQIVWLSARPRGQFEITKNWLSCHGFPYDTIILTGSHSSGGIDSSQGNHFRKVDILKELRPLVYIDDLKCGWEQLEPVLFYEMINKLDIAEINYEVFNNDWPRITKKYLGEKV